MPDSAPPAPPPSATRRRERLILAVAILAAVVAACSPRDLWAPDEPRYGQVAREVLRDGSWLALTVGGEPYAEKPPVWFWLAAVLSAPFGDVTPITARLAGALLAAGAVLLLHRLARRLFQSSDLALTAALLFASTGIVMWNAPRAGLDLPLTFFLLATVSAAHDWWERGGLGAALLAGVSWALAILVKGPMGFFVPPLVVAGGALAARARPARALPGAFLIPLLMAAVGLAWLLPAMEVGGPAYSERLLGQIASRATGQEAGHVRPFYYFFERVGPLTLPWPFLLLAGLGALLGLRRRPVRDRFGLGACAAGTVLILLILSAIATKREVYMIPLLPFAALLAAYALHHALYPRLLGFGRDVAIVTLAVLGLGALLAPLLVRVLWPDGTLPGLEPPEPLAILAMLATATLLLVGAWRAWRSRRTVLASVHTVGLFLLLASTVYQVAFLPFLDPLKSFSRAAAAAEQAAEGGEVYISGFSQIGSVLWCLDRKTTSEVYTLEAAAEVLDPRAPRAAVLAEEPHWARLLGEAREAGEAYAFLERVPRVWEDRVGHRRIVVLTNPPEAQGP